MIGWGSVILAAAAGFNPWLTLLIVSGLARYSGRVALLPGFGWVASVWLLLVLAIALGVDVAGGKLPRQARVVERVSGPISAVAGALLCLAVPNHLLDAGWPVAVAGGALVAATCRLARRWLALSLAKPFGRYRFGYALASTATNLVAAVLAALTFAAGR